MEGLEPTTSCVSGRYSDQLSYIPMAKAVGLEPTTARFGVWCSTELSYANVECRGFLLYSSGPKGSEAPIPYNVWLYVSACQ